MHKPGLDIVVVNYRTPGDLDDFLTSLFAWPPRVPWTLVVVNVEPTRTDTDVAVEWTIGHPDAVVLSFDHNAGYARACNRGALYGEHSVIALFNADVRLTPEALNRCYAALDTNPSWGVLGPRQVDDEGRITAGGILGSPEAPWMRGWHEVDRGQYTDVRSDAVTVSGSAYFVKRAVWRELTDCPIFAASTDPAPEGAFLVTRHYFEETYASYHAREHGHAVVFYGPVTIVHRWHRASPVGGWAEAQFRRSQELFRAACQAHDMVHD